MKTFKYFTIALIALSFLFACEPEEEIVPDVQVKENITSINLEAKTIQSVLDGPPSIELSWESGLQNQAGFVVERSPNDSTHWQEIARLGKQATSFSDIDLPQDASGFYYRIKAIEQGDIPDAFKIFIPVFIPYAFIAPPSELTVTASSATVVELSWQDNSNNERGFIIERCLNGNTWSKLNSVRTGTTTYQDQGLQANTKYFYRVLAFADNPRDRNNPNKSATSDAVEVTTPWRQCLTAGSSHSRNFTFNGNCEMVNVLINGNITMLNGTLRLVNSNIQGNISQFGNGSIEVVFDSEQEGNESKVKGNLIEYGNGSILITGSNIEGDLNEYEDGDISINDDSKVVGNDPFRTYIINEAGSGNINIGNSNLFAHIGEKDGGNIFILHDSNITGDIGEQNDGNITIRDSQLRVSKIGEQSIGDVIIENSFINGQVSFGSFYLGQVTSISEEGTGSLRVSLSNVDANLSENGTGNIDIRHESKIGKESSPKNVSEADGGNVYLRDSSVITGNLAESGYGSLYLDNPSNIYGNFSAN